ncbi:MAG: hypothetical protein ACI3WQ_03200 [Faecousia sp.]
MNYTGLQMAARLCDSASQKKKKTQQLFDAICIFIENERKISKFERL